MAEDAGGPPFEVKPREITIESEGVTLSASLYERPRAAIEPPAEGKKPKKIKEGDLEAPPRAWCILVHGLLSDRNEFGALPDALARLGYGVVAIDVRGHGKSGGPRGVYDVEAAARDIKAVQAYLEREEQWDLNPQQWAVIGHSLGGVVALQAGQHLHAGDLVVAAAVPRSILGEVNPVKRVGYALAHAMTGSVGPDDVGPTLKYEVSYKDIFADQAAMQRAKADGFLQTRIPIRNYPLLAAADGESAAAAVQDPTVLVMAASRDKVVSNVGTRAVYDAVSSAKYWSLIEGSGHSLFLDGQSTTAIKELVDWVSYRLGSFNEVRPGNTKRAD